MIYSILLAQLMAKFVHYTYTVLLPGLVDWSAFLEQVLPTLYIQDWDNGIHGGYYMEGMGLKFTRGLTLQKIMWDFEIILISGDFIEITLISGDFTNFIEITLISSDFTNFKYL